MIEANELNTHISNQFNQELEEVRTNVLTMGGTVESLLETALKGLLKSDSALSQAAIDGDDEVNAQEIEIDEECTRILALRHPTASDLRLVMTVIKTITDLERIGDESEKIGHVSKRLIAEGGLKEKYKRLIKNLGNQVKANLRDVLNAFARLEGEAALNGVKADQDIDDEYESILREMFTYMMEDPRNIQACMDMIWIARALERIGDHAKNIAEHVIYMIVGRDIRHIEAYEHESFESLVKELNSEESE